MTNRIRPVLCLWLTLAACTPGGEPDETARAALATATPPAGGVDAHAAAPGVADVHASGVVDALPPPPAQPWATDEPLREGMTGIARAVAQARSEARAGAFGRGQARSLTSRIEERFQYMATNCRLAPQADAALHALVAQLMITSRNLEADPASPGAMAHLQDVLDRYTLYFEHPGWNAGGYG